MSEWAPGADRRAGWRAALLAAGITPDEDLVVQGDFELEAAREATVGLLRARPDVTAIFAASDEMAMGVVLAARSLGLRVPDDVSVIGVDGHELGELIGLTTIAQPVQDQGTAAARLLLAMITGAPAPEQVIFPTDLVVRTSTAPPRRPASH